MFEILAENIAARGYSIHTNALPDGLSQKLWDLQQSIPSGGYREAGVGRREELKVDKLIRNDRISWIDGTTSAGAEWERWAASLQAFLNARLYLGLSSFESHFSCYSNGGYYQKHQDAFSGQDNRILSIVSYLNSGWTKLDAGELVLFTGENCDEPIIVTPQFGTLVAFMSEEVPHEVLMTNCDRYSIAGWFRLNGSNNSLQ